MYYSSDSPGILVRIPIWDQPNEDQLFEDQPFMKVPADSVPEVKVQGDIEGNKNTLYHRNTTLTIIQMKLIFRS